jgi:hypothetical protein
MATYTLDLNELPHRRTIDVVAGDDIVLLVQLRVNSTAVNLTGATLTLDGTGPGGSAMTARTITPSDAAAGSFDAGLTAAETAAFSTGTGRYQVECTFAAGDSNLPSKIKTLLEITVRVREDRA